jgi:hypothetical protein
LARAEIAKLRAALWFTVVCCCALTDDSGPIQPLQVKEACDGCERAMGVLAGE